MQHTQSVVRSDSVTDAISVRRRTRPRGGNRGVDALWRCVRGRYGDLIVWREVVGALGAAERVDSCHRCQAAVLFCAAFCGLSAVIRQWIPRFLGSRRSLPVAGVLRHGVFDTFPMLSCRLPLRRCARRMLRQEDLDDDHRLAALSAGEGASVLFAVFVGGSLGICCRLDGLCLEQRSGADEVVVA